MSQSENSAIRRRGILASAGSLGVLGALAAIAQSAPGTQKSGEPRPETKTETTGGYRLTEHIKRYYGTAQF